MAFLSKVGTLLRQSAGKKISRSAAVATPSFFQAVRCMSTANSRVFVGGISYQTDEQSLREAFSKYGEVVQARIIVDRETGNSKGFGFVTYNSTEEASSSIQALDDTELFGRRISVKYANERPRFSDGAGYSSGYGSPSGGYGNYGSGFQNGSYGENFGSSDGNEGANVGYGGGSGFQNSNYGGNFSSSGVNQGGNEGYGSDSNYGRQQNYGSAAGYEGGDSYQSGRYGENPGSTDGNRGYRSNTGFNNSNYGSQGNYGCAAGFTYSSECGSATDGNQGGSAGYGSNSGYDKTSYGSQENFVSASGYAGNERGGFGSGSWNAGVDSPSGGEKFGDNGTSIGTGNTYGSSSQNGNYGGNVGSFDRNQAGKLGFGSSSGYGNSQYGGGAGFASADQSGLGSGSWNYVASFGGSYSSVSGANGGFAGAGMVSGDNCQSVEHFGDNAAAADVSRVRAGYVGNTGTGVTGAYQSGEYNFAAQTRTDGASGDGAADQFGHGDRDEEVVAGFENGCVEDDNAGDIAKSA